jgi:DNA-binding NarL/FixJ family response regulator
VIHFMSTPVIAAIPSLSRDTVEFTSRTLYARLDVSSRQTAVLKAIGPGLITPSLVKAKPSQGW